MRLKGILALAITPLMVFTLASCQNGMLGFNNSLRKFENEISSEEFSGFRESLLSTKDKYKDSDYYMYYDEYTLYEEQHERNDTPNYLEKLKERNILKVYFDDESKIIDLRKTEKIWNKLEGVSEVGFREKSLDTSLTYIYKDDSLFTYNNDLKIVSKEKEEYNKDSITSYPSSYISFLNDVPETRYYKDKNYYTTILKGEGFEEAMQYELKNDSITILHIHNTKEQYVNGDEYNIKTSRVSYFKIEYKNVNIKDNKNGYKEVNLHAN